MSDSIMKLSPLSVLVGVLFAAVVFLSMAQTTVGTPLRVEYIPHPRDYFRIAEGPSYTVPAGKVLVLVGAGTALGTGANNVNVSINGTSVEFFFSFSGVNLFAEAPRGMTYGPGTTLQVLDNTAGAQESYAVCYLANQ